MSDNLQQHTSDLSPWRSPQETGFIGENGEGQSGNEFIKGFGLALVGPASLLIPIALLALDPTFAMLLFICAGAFCLMWAAISLLMALASFSQRQIPFGLGILLVLIGGPTLFAIATFILFNNIEVGY